MRMTWEGIAATGGLLGLIATWVLLGYRGAKRRGAQDEQMEATKRDLSNIQTALLAHTAQLAQHEGSFKVIDTKLDHITGAVDDLVARHMEKRA